MRYSEDEYLMLSGIQHFCFCRRQWALIHLEQQWAENVRTVDGEIFHKNAHDKERHETRGNQIIVRGMPVSSATLGISGECDVVEFHRSETGVSIMTLFPLNISVERQKRRIVTVCNLLHRQCVWKKCCAVPFQSDICTMERPDGGLKWKSMNPYEKKQLQC